VPLTPLAGYWIAGSGAALAAGGVSGQGDCFAYDQFPALQQRTSPAKIPGIRKPLYPWDLLVQSPWPVATGSTILEALACWRAGRPDFRRW
jgi:hypothetical protein